MVCHGGIFIWYQAPTRAEKGVTGTEPKAGARGQWNLVATLVGAVIGAGFATGREILQFFGLHGIQGYVGAVLAAALLAWFLAELVRFQGRHHASTYGELYRSIAGPAIGTLLDWLTTLFLFMGLSISLAALAALLSQQWDWPTRGALAASVAVCIMIAAAGKEMVLRFNAGLVPLLLVLLVVLFVCQWFLVPEPPGISPVGPVAPSSAVPAWASGWSWGQPDTPATPYWPLSSLLYLSYNVVLATATLMAVGVSGQLRAGQGRSAGLIIGGMTLAALSVIAPQADVLAEYEIPLAAIANLHGPWVASAFALALSLALLTTAVAQVFGTGSRLGSERQNTPLMVAGVALAATPVAALGFARLLANVYPAMGFVGALFLACFAVSRR